MWKDLDMSDNYSSIVVLVLFLFSFLIFLCQPFYNNLILAVKLERKEIDFVRRIVLCVLNNMNMTGHLWKYTHSYHFRLCPLDTLSME